MFTEFKNTCITSNDRLVNKNTIKQEASPIDIPYELWDQNADDYEIKPVIDEGNNLFRIDVPMNQIGSHKPSNQIDRIEKLTLKRTKPEREICSYCGKKFLCLNHHIKTMHSATLSNTKNFSCRLCFEKFTER